MIELPTVSDTVKFFLHSTGLANLWEPDRLGFNGVASGPSRPVSPFLSGVVTWISERLAGGFQALHFLLLPFRRVRTFPAPQSHRHWPVSILCPTLFARDPTRQFWRNCTGNGSLLRRRGRRKFQLQGRKVTSFSGPHQSCCDWTCPSTCVSTPCPHGSPGQTRRQARRNGRKVAQREVAPAALALGIRCCNCERIQPPGPPSRAAACSHMSGNH